MDDVAERRLEPGSQDVSARGLSQPPGWHQQALGQQRGSCRGSVVLPGQEDNPGSLEEGVHTIKGRASRSRALDWGPMGTTSPGMKVAHGHPKPHPGCAGGFRGTGWEMADRQLCLLSSHK